MERFLTAIAAGLLVTGFFALFRLRQLYLVVPKMFPYSHFSDDGTTVELTVLNRGNLVEQEIEIVLDRKLTYEMLATTRPDISLSSSTIRIPRLPPRAEASVVMMVEGGEFSQKSVAEISSSTTRGKVHSKMQDVPPNVLVIAASIAIVLAIFVTGFYFLESISESARERGTEAARQEIERLNSEREAKETEVTEALKRQEELLGWTGIERYLESRIAKAYTPPEFPIRVIGTKRRGQFMYVDIEFINQMTGWMKFNARLTSNAESKAAPYNETSHFIHDALVAANSRASHTLAVYLPMTESPKLVLVESSLSTKLETIHGLIHEVNID